MEANRKYPAQTAPQGTGFIGICKKKTNKVHKQMMLHTYIFNHYSNAHIMVKANTTNPGQTGFILLPKKTTSKVHNFISRYDKADNCCDLRMVGEML